MHISLCNQMKPSNSRNIYHARGQENGRDHVCMHLTTGGTCIRYAPGYVELIAPPFPDCSTQILRYFLHERKCGPSFHHRQSFISKKFDHAYSSDLGACSSGASSSPLVDDGFLASSSSFVLSLGWGTQQRAMHAAKYRHPDATAQLPPQPKEQLFSKPL